MFALLPLAKMATEQNQNKLPVGSHDDPSWPSAQKPVFAKPNKNDKKRSKKPSRKKGHQGNRRDKPDKSVKRDADAESSGRSGGFQQTCQLEKSSREKDMILTEVSQATAAQTGIGLGAAIAVVLSWYRNKSILLMILHGALSWLYVIYFELTRRDNEKPIR